MKKNYLFDDIEFIKFYEFINKKINNIEFKFVFLFEDEEEKFKIYEYEIKIICVENDYNIVYEKYIIRENEYVKDKIIYEVVDGNIIYYNFKI